MGEQRKFVLYDENYRKFREQIASNVDVANDFMKETNKTLDEHTQTLILLGQKFDYIKKKLNL